ncbi:unnamed protein product [Arctia plantaginis]|uniref:Uncharacterized protein n=1 Tax=Arctia plantaginis TaxID=874455 RepID=A0A8S1B9V5_ARCPL|nr:unnamed protein product [Arctia plantaginis]
MGCGSSGTVAAVTEDMTNGVTKAPNGAGLNGHHHDDSDDLPTVVLPDTPVKPKPPVAFEIPLEEFDGPKRQMTPPAHLQRLLQAPQPDLSLPDIEEKLAEAEQRRLSEHLETKHVMNSLTIPPESEACEDRNI